MCRKSNINSPIPPKKILCNSLYMCVGAVLLKSGNKETLHYSKTRKRPLEIGVFFLSKYSFCGYIPLKIL